jgi:Protein of unknown function (DUF1553)/Protein of unknown function (DUF1549)
MLATVTHLNQPFMPPKEPKLELREIEILRQWILSGAVRAPAAGRTLKPIAKHLTVTERDRKYWAFRKLECPEVPASPDDEWSRTPVDRFIYATLRAKGIYPNPPASRRTLIRRMSYDITGLPPEPRQLALWQVDDAVNALLASPRYGERWGRHWLDVARFAESTGYEADEERPNAYHFRDAVIRALNADLSYTSFVRWQIAGDECAPDNPTASQLTGFLAAGPTITNETGDRVKFQKLDDIVSTLSSAFLGLTVGCARCHDHKYDPIPTRDYYELVGVFNSCSEKSFAPTRDVRSTRLEIATSLAAKLGQFTDLKDRMHRALVELRSAGLGLTPPQIASLLAPPNPKDRDQVELLTKYPQLRIEIRDIEAQYTAHQKALVADLEIDGRELLQDLQQTSKDLTLTMRESSQYPQPNYLLRRGDPNSREGNIGFGFLKVLMSPSDARKKQPRWYVPPPSKSRTPWRRKALANWLVDVDHGAGALLARVMVNRVWQHHFGVGLVSTSSNFGITGESPSHPELLEWLASDFRENGWSLKHLHRLLLNSAVYRQSGVSDARRAAIDPEVRLWWRRKTRRVEAEVWRDSVLFVCGTLNTEMFGPSVKPWIPADAIRTSQFAEKWPAYIIDGPATWRRSIYIFAKRSVQVPMLAVLDLPDASTSCSSRHTSTVPPSALMMLNNDFVREQARHLSARATEHAGNEAVKRIHWLYEVTIGREPDAIELALGRVFLARAGNDVLTNYCHTLLMLNEFLYID